MGSNHPTGAPAPINIVFGYDPKTRTSYALIVNPTPHGTVELTIRRRARRKGLTLVLSAEASVDLALRLVAGLAPGSLARGAP